MRGSLGEAQKIEEFISHVPEVRGEARLLRDKNLKVEVDRREQDWDREEPRSGHVQPRQINFKGWLV